MATSWLQKTVDPFGVFGGDSAFGYKGYASGDSGSSGGASITNFDTRNPQQKLVQGDLAQWIDKYLPGFVPGQPYSGNLSAPMSSFESQGLGTLQNYMNAPDQTPLLAAGGNEVMKTLTGGYDPYSSDFFKATRTGALQDQQDAMNAQNAQLGARGKFFSSEALNENQQLNTRTTNFLNQVLGNMSQQERQNQVSELGNVIPLNKAITEAPLQKVAASQTFGALPRTLDQSSMDKAYQAWLNQRSEEALPVSAAGNFFGSTGQKTVTQTQPQFDWGSFLGDFASSAAMAMLL